MAQLVGQTLGSYRIEEQLGTGGMGEVYRAVHLRLKRTVAIKVMHTHLASNATFQARFLREAQAAAALSHPNIVEVYDFGEQAGNSYLVMELVPNGSLRTLLLQRANGQGWSLALGLDLVSQVAEGLAYAHAQGMVHRDIKPDNLLLRSLRAPAGAPDARQYTVKISDFGLARMVETAGDLTVTGVVVGTPAYMSPEQCQGEPLDGRSDLYSLGVVLYEVATGSLPFQAKTLSEAVFKHISAAPRPPREVRPDLPIELEEVILRCLAKRPEERYATGSDVVEALRGAVSPSEFATVVTPLPAVPTPVRLSAPPVATPPPNTTPPLGATPAPADQQTPITPLPITPLPTSDQYVSPDEPTVAAILPASRSAAGDAADAGAAGDASGAGALGASGVFRARLSTSLAEMRSVVATATASGISRVRGYELPPEMVSFVSSVTTRAKIQAKRYPPWALGDAGAGLVALIVVAVLLFSGRQPANPHSVNPVVHKTATSAAPTTTAATATPVESVKYQDALTSNDRQWPVSSHCRFTSGGYEVSGSFICYAPPSALGAVTISVRARQVGGPADQFYGILLRGVSDTHFYFFGVNAQQQWTFSQVVNGDGNPIVAPTTNNHINAGLNASNTLTVRAQGSHFVFYINDVQVGEADNQALSSGRMALTTLAGGLDVIFNDFKVSVPA